MNLYYVLGLQPTARPEEIKESYNRERARLLSEEGEDDRVEELRALDEAYATLIDPNQRAAYDRSLNQTQVGAIVRTGQPAAIVQPSGPSTPPVQWACPHCRESNPIQASTCSYCGGQISRPCPNCGQLVQLGQATCARCDTLIKEYDQARFAEAVRVEERVEKERTASLAYASTLETVHRMNARLGALFWTVVILLCIALMVLAVVLYSHFSQVYQLSHGA